MSSRSDRSRPLERVEHAGGIVTYRSPALRAAGVVHAFSTRIGGVSRGACASLNLATRALGTPVDEAERVAENHRRLRSALGLGELPLFRIVQVHGAEVALADRAGAAEERRVEADAVVSEDPGVICAVLAADCVPVLLARADGGVVAAVHAGWRGVVAGVVERALHALRELGAPPESLVAAVGPAIAAERFEVGPEVAARFEEADLAGSIRRGRGERPRVDLPGAIAAQLARSGVRPARVDRSDRCTHRDAEEFFSHRRDGGLTGRNAAWVVARTWGIHPRDGAPRGE